MAIVINGSGTVTGLAVGGLPDDSVDEGSLANSINTSIGAKLPLAGGTMTGEVRIANSSATSQLYLYGAANQKANIILNQYGVRAWHIGSGTLASGQLSISDGTTERMRFQHGGVVSIPSGIELGSGVDGTAANTLDDYEEGVCQIRFKAAGNTTLAGSSSMKYTKIGRLVTVSGDMSGNISGLTQNAIMELSGLPFATSGVGTFAFFTRNFQATGSETINTVGYFPSGQAYLQIWTMPNHGNYVQAKVQDFHASTNDCYFSVTYSTAS